MIAGFSFRVDVWVSPDRLEHGENERRSIARMLKEEIESNLESVPGIFQVHVETIKKARRTR